MPVDDDLCACLRRYGANYVLSAGFAACAEGCATKEELRQWWARLQGEQRHEHLQFLEDWI